MGKWQSGQVSAFSSHSRSGSDADRISASSSGERWKWPHFRMRGWASSRDSRRRSTRRS